MGSPPTIMGEHPNPFNRGGGEQQGGIGENFQLGGLKTIGEEAGGFYGMVSSVPDHCSPS